jgi:hypothetical protein
MNRAKAVFDAKNRVYRGHSRQQQQRVRVMATIISALLPPPAVERTGRSGSATGFKAYWRRFFATYRPELHYMRGPGPAWRAKYGDQALFRLKSGDI